MDEDEPVRRAAPIPRASASCHRRRNAGRRDPTVATPVTRSTRRTRRRARRAHHEEVIRGEGGRAGRSKARRRSTTGRHLAVDVDEAFHQRGRSGQRHYRHRAHDLDHRGQGDRVAAVRELEDERLQRSGEASRGGVGAQALATGNAKWKRDPCPGALSTPTAPPCASTIPFTMASPRPVPKRAVSRACQKRSKTWGRCSARRPGPVSATEKTTEPSRARAVHGDRARRGRELDGVAEEVGEDLQDPAAIGADRRRQRILDAGSAA